MQENQTVPWVNDFCKKLKLKCIKHNQVSITRDAHYQRWKHIDITEQLASVLVLGTRAIARVYDETNRWGQISVYGLPCSDYGYKYCSTDFIEFVSDCFSPSHNVMAQIMEFRASEWKNKEQLRFIKITMQCSVSCERCGNCVSQVINLNIAMPNNTHEVITDLQRAFGMKIYRNLIAYIKPCYDKSSIDDLQYNLHLGHKFYNNEGISIKHIICNEIATYICDKYHVYILPKQPDERYTNRSYYITRQ